ANVAGKTLLQRIAPEALLARVFGVLEGLTMFGFALGTLLAELAIATLGIGGALVAVGVAIPALLALLWNPITAIDRHARAIDAEALALLLAQPIFAPLSAPAIERILAELTHVDIPAGQAIIREGDVGVRLLVVLEGAGEVLLVGRQVEVAVAAEIEEDHLRRAAGLGLEGLVDRDLQRVCRLGRREDAFGPGELDPGLEAGQLVDALRL